MSTTMSSDPANFGIGEWKSNKLYTIAAATTAATFITTCGASVPPSSSRTPSSGASAAAHEKSLGRLGFISARGSSSAMKSVKQAFHSVLVPLYGDQTSALRKIHLGADRKCRVAYDQSGGNPSEALGVLVYKSQPSDEYGPLGLKRSFEIKTLLLLNSDRNSGMGYGTEILHYALERAGSYRADNVHVTVSSEVPSSVSFFVKNGFKMITSWEDRYKSGETEYLLARSLRGADSCLNATFLLPPTPPAFSRFVAKTIGSGSRDVASDPILAHHNSPTQLEQPTSALCSGIVSASPPMRKRKRSAAYSASDARSDYSSPARFIVDESPAHNHKRSRSSTMERYGQDVPYRKLSYPRDGHQSLQTTPLIMKNMTPMKPPQRPLMRKRTTSQHEVTLMKKYLHMIRDGRKTVEGRINSGMFRGVGVDDTIRFFYKACPQDDVRVRVVAIQQYSNFENMLRGEGVKACLPDCQHLRDGIRIYNAIPGYSDRAARSGVLGLKLEVLRH